MESLDFQSDGHDPVDLSFGLRDIILKGQQSDLTQNERVSRTSWPCTLHCTISSNTVFTRQGV